MGPRPALAAPGPYPILKVDGGPNRAVVTRCRGGGAPILEEAGEHQGDGPVCAVPRRRNGAAYAKAKMHQRSERKVQVALWPPTPPPPPPHLTDVGSAATSRACVNFSVHQRSWNGQAANGRGAL